MANMLIRAAFLIFTMFIALAATAHAQTQAELWTTVRSGEAVAMMRHALAPGTGDPSNFTLGDCSTQRNLSDEGRHQARRLGERFRDNGIRAAEVMTSQWCRCRETAELIGLAPPQDLPLLNSFFANRGDRDAQTHQLVEWLTNRQTDQPLVLVTHQVNITALTGVFPRSGEIVVFTLSPQGEITVLGSLRN